MASQQTSASNADLERSQRVNRGKNSHKLLSDLQDLQDGTKRSIVESTSARPQNIPQDTPINPSAPNKGPKNSQRLEPVDLDDSDAESNSPRMTFKRRGSRFGISIDDFDTEPDEPAVEQDPDFEQEPEEGLSENEDLQAHFTQPPSEQLHSPFKRNPRNLVEYLSYSSDPDVDRGHVSHHSPSAPASDYEDRDDIRNEDDDYDQAQACTSRVASSTRAFSSQVASNHAPSPFTHTPSVYNGSSAEHLPLTSPHIHYKATNHRYPPLGVDSDFDMLSSPFPEPPRHSRKQSGKGKEHTVKSPSYEVTSLDDDSPPPIPKSSRTKKRKAKGKARVVQPPVPDTSDNYTPSLRPEPSHSRKQKAKEKAYDSDAIHGKGRSVLNRFHEGNPPNLPPPVRTPPTRTPLTRAPPSSKLPTHPPPSRTLPTHRPPSHTLPTHPPHSRQREQLLSTKMVAPPVPPKRRGHISTGGPYQEYRQQLKLWKQQQEEVDTDTDTGANSTTATEGGSEESGKRKRKRKSKKSQSRKGGCQKIPQAKRRRRDDDDDGDEAPPDQPGGNTKNNQPGGRKRATRNSINPTASGRRLEHQYKSFPVYWQGVTDDAIDHCRYSLAVKDSFPNRVKSWKFARQALKLALDERNSQGLPVEDDWFNNGGKANMLYYIRNDRSTYRSTIRAFAKAAADSRFDFGNEKARNIIQASRNLLRGGRYLHKTSITGEILALFQGEAVFDLSVSFVYANPNGLARIFPKRFRHCFPTNTLGFIAIALCHQLEWHLNHDAAFSEASYKNTYREIIENLQEIESGTFVGTGDEKLSASEQRALVKDRQKQLKAFCEAIAEEGRHFLNTPRQPAARIDGGPLRDLGI
ncbi:hypothetical protein BDN72DRAFT_905515 [Pluteus cervinus]|uniref:Uncharacterized protein n=1 Tax=Pluteus cervinus TaxID=181527 RepID=A0ACD3A1S3_9AGAR|nr:hypothetical protein BDN72DRAFT_905515 [Pluteus cervinus]